MLSLTLTGHTLHPYLTNKFVFHLLKIGLNHSFKTIFFKISVSIICSNSLFLFPCSSSFYLYSVYNPIIDREVYQLVEANWLRSSVVFSIYFSLAFDFVYHIQVSVKTFSFFCNFFSILHGMVHFLSVFCLLLDNHYTWTICKTQFVCRKTQ